VGAPHGTVQHLLLLRQLYLNLALELDFTSKDLVFDFTLLCHELAIFRGDLDFILIDCPLCPCVCVSGLRLKGEDL
jgi:hypothetical protein